MALILTPEDGSGRADANSYASVEQADAYHEAHLHAVTWSVASPDRKAAALAHASRLLDNLMQWRGVVANPGTQALQWPRSMVTTRNHSVGFWGVGQLANNALPQALVQATAELARKLMEGDRTADPDTQGIKSLGLGQGAVELEFDPRDRPGVIPDTVLAMLSDLGHLKGKGMLRTVTR